MKWAANVELEKNIEMNFKEVRTKMRNKRKFEVKLDDEKNK